jgi:hypothetical protein
MTELIITKVGKASIVGISQHLCFYNASIMGTFIPTAMFGHFYHKDVIKPAPFEIKADMTAQIVKGEEGLLGIIVSNSLINGTVVPTTPFVEANLLVNGFHQKGDCINSDVDAMSHWDSWIKNYNIDKIIDERGKSPVAINVDRDGGIILPP